MDKIIGFQSGHDVSYCVLENGIPTIHEELERFSREKNSLGDGLKMFYEHYNGKKDNLKYFSFGNFSGRSGQWENDCKIPYFDGLMRKTVAKNKGEFFELSHHMCHAANAFFSSNYKSSLIITIDGGGNESLNETTACTIYKGHKNSINKLKVFPINNLNIGLAWDFITQSFGLSIGHPKGHQAGTVMAMAGLSECEKYVDPIIDIIQMKKVSGNEAIENTKKIFEKNHSNQKVQFDIARSLQIATELVIKDIISDALKLHPSKNLCLAGGCALNSVMVGKIKSWFPQIENIYVPPVPTDAGLAIGSAQYVWHQIFKKDRINWKDNFTPYLGKKYTNSEIMDNLKDYDSLVKLKEVDDNDVIELLNNQKIISIFGKGSESGRRALGNRSILADPRSENMKKTINDKVKHRQWFRPFAPSIIQNEVKNWFTLNEESPYMSMVLKWKRNKGKIVPAVNHFDNSARLQTVTENDNPWYFNFLQKWKNKTQVPILLNTSFNDSEPIVETPKHAVNCFLKTNIDYIYFHQNNTLVSKQ